MPRINDQFDVQAVMAKEQVLPGPSNQLARVAQVRLIPGPIGPTALLKGDRAIEECLGPSDDLAAALGIISLRCRGVRYSIRAIKGVVETAPPCICRIEQEPGINPAYS
jgi:hypothetical protein